MLIDISNFENKSLLIPLTIYEKWDNKASYLS